MELRKKSIVIRESYRYFFLYSSAVLVDINGKGMTQLKHSSFLAFQEIAREP